MASIRKRGDTWSFRLSLNDPRTGKRVQPERGGFKTKRAAEQAAKILESEILNNSFVRETDITFGDFSVRWLEMYLADGRRKESSGDVRRVGLNRLNKFFQFRKLKDITPAAYQKMLIELRDLGYAHQTIMSTHATAKLLFNKAVEIEILKKSPTLHSVVPVHRKSVEELEQEEGLPKYFEKEELAHLLDYALRSRPYQEYAQYQLLAYTGMRIGEVCVLKWSDVDFEEKTVNITKTLYAKNNNTKEFKIQPPKTASSKRKITIDDLTVSVLQKQRAEQLKFMMKRRNEYTDFNFVFTNTKRYPGYPEMQKYMQERMHRLLPACGLPGHMTPHTLRHTHVSILAEAKMPLETIQDRLGHRDDSTTRRIYQHITKSMKKEAAEAFAAIMKL